MSFKNTLKKTLLAGITAAALCGPGLANAVDFRFNWGATGEGFYGGPFPPIGTPISDPVRNMKFTAESVVVFHGVPFAPGTTFTDYILLRVDSLTAPLGGLVLPYGVLIAPPSPLAFYNMEITAKTVLTGVQNTALTYSITGFNSFGLYYDGPTGGFTNASFTGPLGAFTDGALVEDATSITGSGVNDPASPNGSLTARVGLNDLIGPSDFELTAAGTPAPIGSHFLGVTLSNNKLCSDNPGAPVGAFVCQSSTAAILAHFGVVLAPGDFAIHTGNDGTIEKLLAVPEPATLGLLGLAFAVMGFVTNRRRKTLVS